jgi:hypothetical protein
VKLQDRNKAWGFSLFGDDMRVEVGGKMSLMGLYQADMFFPDNAPYPVNIPRFCILIMYYEIIGAIEDDVTFKVTFGPENQVVAELPVLRKDLRDLTNAIQPNEADATPEDKERIFHSRIPIMLSPFAIPSKGRLRVRAHYSDGSVLKLGSISVREVSLEDFNRMLGQPPLPNPS